MRRQPVASTPPRPDGHGEQPILAGMHDIIDFMIALRATGAKEGEVCALAANVYGREAVMPFLVKSLEGQGGPRALAAMMNEVTRLDPTLAHSALEKVGTTCRVGEVLGNILKEFANSDQDRARHILAGWGRNRRVPGDLNLPGLAWLQTLPEGLSVEGSLFLVGCHNLNSLTDDLEVGGSLLVDQCRSLQTLPPGLAVGGHLSIAASSGLSHLRDTEIRAMAPGIQGDIKRV